MVIAIAATTATAMTAMVSEDDSVPCGLSSCEVKVIVTGFVLAVAPLESVVLQ